MSSRDFSDGFLVISWTFSFEIWALGFFIQYLSFCKFVFFFWDFLFQCTVSPDAMGSGQSFCSFSSSNALAFWLTCFHQNVYVHLLIWLLWLQVNSFLLRVKAPTYTLNSKLLTLMICPHSYLTLSWNNIQSLSVVKPFVPFFKVHFNTGAINITNWKLSSIVHEPSVYIIE